MREQSDATANDFDWLGYVSVLWRGKWLILGIAIAALIAGLGYSGTIPAAYQVRSKIQVDLYSIDRQYNCGPVVAGRGLDCYERGSLAAFSKALGPDWAISATNVATLNTATPDTEAVYTDQLANAAKQTNEALLKEANLLLTISEQRDAYILEKSATVDDPLSVAIGGGRNEALLQIAKLEAGVNAVQFEPPSIVKVEPNRNLILLSALVLGIMGGAVLVSLRAARLGRQTKAAN